MRRAVFTASSMIALLGLALLGPSGESAVLLRHRFEEGGLRRYRCEMETRQDSSEGCFENRMVMIEEERCHGIEGGLADVSYEAIAMAVEDYENGERVYAASDTRLLEMGSEFERKALQDRIGLGERLRYLIDADMNVVAVALPETLSLSERHRQDESYRRALNARYRSFFPRQPIACGDTWTSEIPFDEGFWSKHEHVSRDDYRVHARHAGVEMKAGRSCIRLELEISLADAREVLIRRGSHDRSHIEALDAKSTVWFDLEAGTPVLEISELEASLRREIRTGSDDWRSVTYTISQRIRTALEDPASTEPIAILAREGECR